MQQSQGETWAESESVLKSYPLQDWMQGLDQMLPALQGLIADREGDFLQIGSGVRELSQMARDLAHGAIDLAGQASGQGLQEGVQELQASIHRMDSSQGQADLGHIQQKCQELTQPVMQLQKEMFSFRPILKHLRVLSMSIRIESARLGSEGSRFQSLAQEVEALGQKTDSYSREVTGKTHQLLQRLEVVQHKVQSAREGQDTAVAPLLQGVQSNVAELSRLQAMSERISGSVSQRSQNIKEQIEEIYSSVQFHDISRQQVEHVQHVLEEVREVLQSELRVEQQEEARDLVAWLGDVSGLQVRQLEATREELARAMQRIRQSLESIGSAVAAQEKELQEFPGLGAAGEESVLSTLERDAAKLRSSLQSATSSFTEVISNLEDMAGVLQEVEGFLGTLQEIGDEVELIALNASIKSAHTGDMGRPLGVLAEAIRKLSQEAKQLVQRVSQALQQISSLAQDFQAQAQEARTGAQETEKLCSALDEILGRISLANVQVGELYSFLQEQGRSFLHRTRNLQDKLELQYQVEEDMAGIMNKLREVEEQVCSYVPRETQTSHSQRLDDILRRYTMESERLVHLAFSGHEETSSESREQKLASGQDTEEFEDNVELF
ncbi:MAG: methyl-accepting chemotaxis protein [Desulfohalobiaceae bacterium]